MSVEVLDGSSDMSDYDEPTQTVDFSIIDARRRVEDKIEEIRLRREVQDYDFDI